MSQLTTQWYQMNPTTKHMYFNCRPVLPRRRGGVGCGGLASLLHADDKMQPFIRVRLSQLHVVLSSLPSHCHVFSMLNASSAHAMLAGTADPFAFIFTSSNGASNFHPYNRLSIFSSARGPVQQLHHRLALPCSPAAKVPHLCKGQTFGLL